MTGRQKKTHGAFDWSDTTKSDAAPPVAVNASLNLLTNSFDITSESSAAQSHLITSKSKMNFGPKLEPERLWTMDSDSTTQTAAALARPSSDLWLSSTSTSSVSLSPSQGVSSSHGSLHQQTATAATSDLLIDLNATPGPSQRYHQHTGHQGQAHEALATSTFKLNADLDEEPVFVSVEDNSLFRQRPVVPQSDDILYPQQIMEDWISPSGFGDPSTAHPPGAIPSVPVNLVHGKYRSTDQYLDTHFELMRQDTLIPLQKAVKSYRATVAPKAAPPPDLFDQLQVTQTAASGVPPISSGFRLYEHVHLNAVVYGSHRLLYRIGFRLPYHVRISWPQSKRLVEGTLVLLSSDHFEHDIKVATVVYRGDEPMRGSNRFEYMIDVALERDNDEDPLGYGDPTGTDIKTYTMIEATDGYFEAYRHILNVMKTIPSDELPFQKYLVDLDLDMRVPYYAAHKRYFDIDTSPKRRQSGHRKPVDIMDNWPPYDIGMDKTQMDALQTILSNELAIIQGPPGTGKTFVGTYAMQVLLSNYDRSVGPIVCICQTNHALDQFLEHIYDYDNRIVRVGGRSKSEILKDNVLFELRKNSDIRPRGVARLYRQRDELQKAIKDLLAELYEEPCVTLDFVAKHKFLRPRQLDSLRRLGERDAKRGGLAASKTIFDADGEDDDWNVSSQAPAAVRVSAFHHNPPSRQKYSRGPGPATASSDWDTGNVNHAQPAEPKAVDAIEVWLRDAIEFVNPGGEQSSLSEDLKNQFFDQQKGRLFEDDDAEEDLIEEDELKEITQNFFDGSDVRSNKAAYTNINRFYKPVGDSGQRNPAQSMYQAHVVGFQHPPKSTTLQRKVLNYKKPDPYRAKTTKGIKSAATFDFFSDDEDDDDDGEIVFSATAKMHETAEDPEDHHEVLERWMKDDDVTLWPLPVRLQAHKIWATERNRQIASKINGLAQSYDRLSKDIRKLRIESDALLCRQSRVVGLTSTGAAKHHDLLEAMKPTIMVVEEAAEMLESHIVTALTSSLQHLILIGDHQQLRPSTAVYTLSHHHHLNVSLFERLVNNDVPYTRLSHQRRMRPEIRALINPIYSDPPLQDHPHVTRYPPVAGMDKNLFFLAHEEPEENMAETASKCNVHEAQMAARLATYLMLQGYTSKDISIITMYAGQRTTIRRYLREERRVDLDPTAIRVSSVDGYQGEENKIIILSLVRSNMHGQIGFLKVANRVCVALSRAKHGMYVLGNARLLCERDDLWNEIVANIEDDVSPKIGTDLPLKCSKHGIVTQVRWPVDFVEVKEGGCHKPCGTLLDCGHQCPLRCHNFSHDEVRCHQPCRNIHPECGHTCTQTCSAECGLCYQEIRLTLPCGHLVQGSCGKLRREVKARGGKCSPCHRGSSK
ncbi:P-loop containing nucleoside triphosphate hydrolase protein [Hesseltinella vesiculosa]|uniref:P-loop containing nucleoside triphosphate hydrolase protein n=1 Tax=Hesseltinella vesiculosa TaxID=101127 RepID=A0A1X2GA08_9FUNG|nr:P-loop containing nucleoside triphosphate hydrolase protein [Hesseltinella vesiculosa]